MTKEKDELQAPSAAPCCKDRDAYCVCERNAMLCDGIGHDPKKQELEQYKKDAERYRWLRRGGYPLSFAVRVLNDTPFGIDESIDKAMKG